MASFRNILSSPMAILKITIALCYMGLGIYLLVNTQLLYFIDMTYRKVLAWGFVVYGAFRLVRALTDSPNKTTL
ncbi:MAG: hypothetical protein JWO03_3719 [Bacteroidetes bacterium]|nr:hypothetical protein [Bacteroidota bacterium]